MNRGTAFQFAFFFFLLMLLALGFVWASWNVSPELARLERILAVLEKHPAYFWRVRPHLNTEFEGGRVATDSNGFRLVHPNQPDPIPENPFRVFVFGASPTFGYGVEAEQTYSKVAEGIMRKTDPTIFLKNLGQIGYSSFQGRKLFSDRIDRDRPDMATVSYMVNDIDRLRFFFSNGREDLRTDPPSAFHAAWYNRAYAFSPTAWFLKQQRRLVVKLFGGISRRGSFELSHVRVRPEDYQKNLEFFVSDCNEKKIPLILIKMPFRLPEAIPPAPGGIEEEMARVDRLVEEGRFDDAEALIAQVLKTDPFCSKAFYYRGRVLEAEEDEAKAHEAYAQAVKFLIYDCRRDADRYNQIMESVAMNTRTPLVDAAAGLGSDRAEMDLFVPNDYIHPNREGHRIIGECLSRALLRYRSGDGGMFIERCGREDTDLPQ